MSTSSEENIYWSEFRYKEWTMHVATTNRGLCYIGYPNQSFTDMVDWADKQFKKARLSRDDAKLENYTKELTEFLEGNRKKFTFPIDLNGTDFQKQIWQALQSIPYGITYTYSQIAEAIHNPKAVRAVGAAIGANPIPIMVPCHRVIGKSGQLTGYRGGIQMKEFLLNLEKSFS